MLPLPQNGILLVLTTTASSFHYVSQATGTDLEPSLPPHPKRAAARAPKFAPRAASPPRGAPQPWAPRLHVSEIHLGGSAALWDARPTKNGKILWMGDILHHLRNPGMMIFLTIPSNNGPPRLQSGRRDATEAGLSPNMGQEFGRMRFDGHAAERKQKEPIQDMTSQPPGLLVQAVANRAPWVMTTCLGGFLPAMGTKDLGFGLGFRAVGNAHCDITQRASQRLTPPHKGKQLPFFVTGVGTSSLIPQPWSSSCLLPLP